MILIGILIPFPSHFNHLQGQSQNNKSDTTRLRLYLDCDECDFAYFRNNLQYVDYVRDPKVADVHLLVTEQRTGSNGTSFGLNFIGQQEFEDIGYKLHVFSPQSDTDLKTWERLLKTTGMGLMPYVARTPQKDLLTISSSIDSTAAGSSEESPDRWDYWVFRFDLFGDIFKEESQNNIGGNTSFRVDRITDQLKFRADISYFRYLERFQDGEEVIEANREMIDSDIEAVYSLGPRWSTGLFTEFRSSTYENIDFGFSTGPAIEYNIFPWDESDRRIFAVSYHVSLKYADYTEETVYELMTEMRVQQSMRLNFVMRQPWGEIETELVGSNFFHDFTKNRLALESEISLNVTKGLSVFAAIEGSIIHDQLNLAAGEVSREELLLRQRQLETSYEIFGGFGIRFTFGSIYNNIVNYRL